MPFILVFFLSLNAFGGDFISPMEYAKMLYESPRGIGCHKCHGDRGEGKVIARYKEIDKQDGKNKQKKFKVPPINNISEKKFIEALRSGKGIMPTYFLTKYEAQSLYYYIKEQQK